MADESTTSDAKDARLVLTFYMAIVSLAVVLVAFVVTVAVFAGSDRPGEIIPAVLGPVVAVAGTLAGYVAGQTAGAAGKEKAEARADEERTRASKAESQAESAKSLLRLATMDHVDANQLVMGARDQFPDLFESPRNGGQEGDRQT